ncbi:MAG: rRNA maturation RNase YbeY [Gammaproteobacteria bacterium]|nr:rRNA maturation RNase YbeY [Gammaproteobacteria bacterium]
MVRLFLDLHVAWEGPQPSRRRLVRFARAAVADMDGAVRVGMRIVGAHEGAGLNRQYRHKNHPTNVLSFPYDTYGGRTRFLGDLAICGPVVDSEAQAAGIPAEAHWAHMVIHGIMHLRGYDHVDDEGAAVMERLESQVLKSLGFPDPYHEL